MIGIGVGVGSPLVAGVVIVVLLLAGIVKGTIGFGPALVSVPVLVQAFDPKVAIAAFSIPMLIGNLVILWRDGVSWGEIRPHARLVGTVFLATIVGAVGLVALPADLLSLTVGVAVLAYLVVARRSADGTLIRYATHRWSEYAPGSVGGVLGGALGMGGVPLATYLDARELDRDVFTLVLVTLLALKTPSGWPRSGAAGCSPARSSRSVRRSSRRCSSGSWAASASGNTSRRIASRRWSTSCSSSAGSGSCTARSRDTDRYDSFPPRRQTPSREPPPRPIRRLRLERLTAARTRPPRSPPTGGDSPHFAYIAYIEMSDSASIPSVASSRPSSVTSSVMLSPSLASTNASSNSER
jgi:hypothetical protein